LCGAGELPAQSPATDGEGQSASRVRGLLFESRKENEVRFEVKGQEYFLTFVEQENRLYVFAPTANGIQRMPYVDAVKWKVGGAAESRHLSS